MPPLVSILIPAYNAQEWMSDTIKSALAQTWPRTEIIIVDDGSTDRTLDIARQFAGKSVSVFTQTNHGAAEARNRAFGSSHGDYIQWLDADDLLAPDKISRQMNSMKQEPNARTLLSSAWGRFTHRPSHAQFSVTPLWENLAPIEWLVRKLGLNLCMPPATWLVSRELTLAAGPWNTRLSLDDDGEYFCRVILASQGIRFIPEARVFYRRGFESLSYLGQSARKLESQFLSMQLQVGHLRAAEDSERVRTACVKCLQMWLGVFYPERLDLVKELEQLAAAMGKKLVAPRLSWKYAWIKAICGWRFAKRVQHAFNKSKRLVLRVLDKALFRIEKRKLAND